LTQHGCTENMLEIKGLMAGYGKLTVLHDINLTVQKGSLTAIVGPNGAGKTTLMNSILHVNQIMKGEILYNGKTISAMEPHEIAAMGIGYVPQARNVFPGMTVEENLDMGTYLSDPHADTKKMIEAIYTAFPRLKERKKQKASTLSGGERQMLALGSVLLLKPELLILDEPITGLAPQIVTELIESIMQIKEQGTTLLWVVEENPMQILPLSDIVYVMDGGTIKTKKTGMEFVGAPDFMEMFLGN